MFTTTTTFVVYIFAMIVIGIVAARSTSSLNDYVLGGRRLGRVITGLSAGASDMSGWLLMGLPGALYVAGISQAWIAIGLTVGQWCNWKFVAARLRSFTQNASDALLKNSEGKPVVNQEIIKMAYIYYLRLESKCKIKLCHINSHCSINNLDKDLKKFNKKNKMKLNIEEYELLYAINDECDKMVAECYTGYIISQK